jgi:hypothetical protein
VAASYESRTLDFVIRIWLEERPQGEQPPQWRGYVTHVLSGRQQYFQELNDLVRFLESYITVWREQEQARYE